MTIDHVAFSVAKSDFDAVIAFYVAALAPLGYKEKMRFPIPGDAFVVGLGGEKSADVWISGTDGERPVGKIHVALSAPDRATVDAFHKAALAHGAKDNGAPGVRAHYHPNYYGAFVFDPAGTNVEVVCHCAEEAEKK